MSSAATTKNPAARPGRESSPSSRPPLFSSLPREGKVRGHLRKLTEEVTFMAYTREEKQALVRQARQAVKEGKAPAFLPQSIEGKGYSLTNTMLILLQAPYATVLGGFRQWKAAGRQVRKGERGILIWVPSVSRQEGEGEGEGPAEVHFLTGYVFDVAQTEPTGLEA